MSIRSRPLFDVDDWKNGKETAISSIRFDLRSNKCSNSRINESIKQRQIETDEEQDRLGCEHVKWLPQGGHDGVGWLYHTWKSLTMLLGQNRTVQEYISILTVYEIAKHTGMFLG